MYGESWCVHWGGKAERHLGLMEPSVYLGKWIQMMMENNAVRALVELAQRKHTEELSKFMGMGRGGLFSRILVFEPWQKGNVDSKD